MRLEISNKEFINTLSKLRPLLGIYTESRTLGENYYPDSGPMYGPKVLSDCHFTRKESNTPTGTDFPDNFSTYGRTSTNGFNNERASLEIRQKEQV